ncbi:di-heme cytochrome c [Methylocaldum marinum]|uniref:Di-heme cytochrome c n=1 Tax=Methylocaldum marinum TaxID=1432792 RepID=A0A250KQW6_9GAMM|nr:c-type cytochrome [Methylocaldum marinum]BBA33987.1 di-heme cytochrome c [Methylocaldum marinum]
MGAQSRRTLINNMKASGTLIALVLLGACDRSGAPSPVSGGDPARGRIAFQQYACTTCHIIPGIVGAKGLAGPPLTDWANRVYIAGVLPNTPDDLVLWLQDPERISPGTAMPDLGVTERDAWDMAAYLFSLK